jgi:uncharacterized protein
LRAFLGLLFFLPLAHAEFSVPAQTGPVVDAGEMLNFETQDRLAAFLQRLKDSGGAEIQVVTLPDLGGLSIEEASIKIADKWKLGNAKQDNGVILVVSKAERKVRIEVGQGQEGNVPDITASRIVHDVIIPRFKNGDIDRGVVDGVLSIVHYTDPQFLEGQNAAPAPRGARRHGKSFDWIFFLLFFLFFILPAFSGRRRRRSGLGGALLGYGLGRAMGGRGGGWGGGSSGGSWGGGGGGFSGGGASGSW